MQNYIGCQQRRYRVRSVGFVPSASARAQRCSCCSLPPPLVYRGPGSSEDEPPPSIPTKDGPSTEPTGVPSSRPDPVAPPPAPVVSPICAALAAPAPAAAPPPPKRHKTMMIQGMAVSVRLAYDGLMRKQTERWILKCPFGHEGCSKESMQ